MIYSITNRGGMKMKRLALFLLPAAMAFMAGCAVVELEQVGKEEPAREEILLGRGIIYGDGVLCDVAIFRIYDFRQEWFYRDGQDDPRFLPGGDFGLL